MVFSLLRASFLCAVVCCVVFRAKVDAPAVREVTLAMTQKVGSTPVDPKVRRCLLCPYERDNGVSFVAIERESAVPLACSRGTFGSERIESATGVILQHSGCLAGRCKRLDKPLCGREFLCGVLLRVCVVPLKRKPCSVRDACFGRVFLLAKRTDTFQYMVSKQGDIYIAAKCFS